MTNVRRPIHLQLQRPSTTMVSSSSGPGPFGLTNGGSGGGGGGGGNGGMLGLNPGGANGAAAQQQTPPQLAPRGSPIRPNALIMCNCIAHTPTLPNGLASPMMMPARPSRLTATTPSQRPNSLTAPSLGLNAPTPATTTPNNSNFTTKSPTCPNDLMPSQIMPHLFVGDEGHTNRETINKFNIKYILSLGLLPMILTNNNSNTSFTTLTPVSPTSANKKAASKQLDATAHSRDHHNHRNHHHNNHPHHHHHHQLPQNLMPAYNSSRDFKIRIRSNTPTTPNTPNQAHVNASTVVAAQPQPQTTTSSLETSNCLASSNNLNRLPPPATPAPNPKQPDAANQNQKLVRNENKKTKQVRSVYCKCINVADRGDESISKFFDEAFAFIEEARRKKCNILIHCLAGISRSPTIAIAYLMRVRSLHWQDAYDFVQQCRPQIEPNISFICQLMAYNKSLKDEHNSPIASKRNGNNINNESMFVKDDCQTTIENSKTICCIEHNNGKLLVGNLQEHQSKIDDNSNSRGIKLEHVKLP